MSRKKAKDYVRNGRAQWSDDCSIRFVEDHPIQRSAAEMQAHNEATRRFISEGGYDRTAQRGHVATMKEATHVPIVGDYLRLFRAPSGEWFPQTKRGFMSRRGN